MDGGAAAAGLGGGSQAKAAELGFQMVERGVFVTAVPPLEVTDLHQERRTIPLD